MQMIDHNRLAGGSDCEPELTRLPTPVAFGSGMKISSDFVLPFSESRVV